MERFAGAYTGAARGLRGATCSRGGPPPITIEDGMQAMRIGVAATQACASGQPVAVASVKEG